MTIEPRQQYTVADYFRQVHLALDSNLIADWDIALKILADCWHSNSTILVAANGGNHLNALHFATDWRKGLAMLTGKPLRCVVVGENSGLMSAIENDCSHEQSIVEYYTFQGVKCDLFLLLSAGGTSKNILAAANYARNNGITTVGLLGGTSHENSSLFDYKIHVKSDDIQIIEDIHAQFGHTLLKFITHGSKVNFA